MKMAILEPNFSEYAGNARVAAQQAEDLAIEITRVSTFSLARDIESKSANSYQTGNPKKIIRQRIFWLLFPLFIIKINKWLPMLEGQRR